MGLKTAARAEIVRELVLKCRLLEGLLLLLMSQVALDVLEVSPLWHIKGINGLIDLTHSSIAWVSR